MTQITAERPNIRLLADRLLVKILSKEEVKTASGIIMPTSNGQDASTQQGEVLRCSKRIENLDADGDNEDGWDKIEEGETVLFSSFAGSEVFFKGVNYKILRITDVFGVIE